MGKLYISKILFIDKEGLSKMWISSQLFFKDFVDRFGTTDIHTYVRTYIDR